MCQMLTVYSRYFVTSQTTKMVYDNQFDIAAKRQGMVLQYYVP